MDSNVSKTILQHQNQGQHHWWFIIAIVLKAIRQATVVV